MFGIPYEWAEIIVGSVMLAYVLFGGMLATTWVQIIKAVLLLIGVTVLTVLVMAKFAWSPGNLYTAVSAKYGQVALQPGGFVSSPIEAVSLGLALMFGLLGLPHILMRFYTVPDAKAARKSVLYATGLIGYFYVIIPIVGFGAAVLVGRDVINKIAPGGNMAAPLLGELLGGQAFLGFISAVAFATILAVVAGLTLAGASAFSHDIYVSVIKRGRASEEDQLKVARIATIVFGVCAIALGIAFKGQNVAFMVGLAFAIAASANFPALLMSIVWKRFTTQGAVWSILVGAFTSLAMIVLSPTVWVAIFKFEKAIVPLKQPAIFSMSLAFAVGIIVSLLTPEPEAQRKFEDEKVRTYLGVGAE
jgi:cation/acetate symporter